ncbi:hypothetical protein Bca52824_032879, partial [Brassica carinata]
DENYVLISFLTLINYKGKLGALVFDNGDIHQLCSWVLLDDNENDKCLKRSFSLQIGSLVEKRSIRETDTGDIVWAPSRWTYPFYVFYCNMERQSVRSVEIKVIEEKVIGRDPKPC